MGLFFSTAIHLVNRVDSGAEEKPFKAHYYFGTDNTKSQPDKHTPNKFNAPLGKSSIKLSEYLIWIFS